MDGDRFNRRENITEEIIDFIGSLRPQSYITEERKHKLEHSIRFMMAKRFGLVYLIERDKTHMIILVDTQTPVEGTDSGFYEIGHFTISDLLPDGSTDMSISIDDNYKSENLQKNGLARLLIASMVYKLYQSGNYKDQSIGITLRIDTDASQGFWDSIGMRPNPDYVRERSERRPFAGYEKIISLADLSKWAIGFDIFLEKVRKTKGGTKRKRKTNKRNRKTKSNRRRRN